MLHLTLSEIEAYKRCPKEYELTFRKRAPVTAIDNLNLAEISFLRTLYALLKDEGSPPGAEEISRVFHGEWKMRHARFEPSMDDDYPAEELQLLAISALEKFFSAYEKGRYGTLLCHDIRVEIPGERFALVHRLHLVFQSNPGEFLALRFRFSTATPKVHPEDDRLIADYAAARHHTGYAGGAVRIIFPWFESELTYKPHDETLAAWRERIDAYSAMLLSAEEFPGKPGRRCLRCRVRARCDEAAPTSQGKAPPIHDPILRMARIGTGRLPGTWKSCAPKAC